MTELTKFFTALSERARKENDLSDITYAMCEANLEFQKFFLDFFFRIWGFDEFALERICLVRTYGGF